MADQKRLCVNVCKWTGCTWANQESLVNHVREVHTAQKSTCMWDGCGYYGKTKQKLQMHLRTHTGEKPFKCTVCEKAFASSTALKIHMRTHTGEKPYKCTVCEKAFVVSGHLTTHMRTHTGAKPFKCTVCEHSCAQPQHLTIHMRTHTSEKPFKCDVCEKAFSESGKLKVHMRTHSGDKPYTCTVCEKTFATSGNLTTHMRTHTDEKPYTCTFCDCDYTSARSCSLKAHIRIHHTGPWCVICKECWVPEENMICGRCNMHANYGVKEKRFFDFMYAYDERLAEVYFTLRDEAMGCGVRKRPDGLMQLQTKAVVVDIEAAMETTLVEDDYQVKLIIECDEHQHNSYSPSCELARLQAIQERDNDAVYVLRYNVDQPDAFNEVKLGAFCDRVLAVLEGDFMLAVKSPTLFEIEYFGYTEARRALLEQELLSQQN